MSSTDKKKREEQEGGGGTGSGGGDSGTKNMNTAAARVRTFGSASGVFTLDTSTAAAASNSLSPPPLQAAPPEPPGAGNNAGGSVMAGIFGEEGDDTDNSAGQEEEEEEEEEVDSVSRALDADRRIADATAELLGRDFNDSIDNRQSSIAGSPTKARKDGSVGSLSAASVVSNEDDTSTLADLESVTGEELSALCEDVESITGGELSALREDEMIKGLLELRDIVREARKSNRNESDGALSFLEAFDDVVETIASSATGGDYGGGDDGNDVASAIIRDFGAGSADSGTDPLSPSSVSSFEQKVVADRQLHRRMMSRDGRQAFDKTLQTEAEALTSKMGGRIVIPPSHPIRKVLPYIPHLHAIFINVHDQLTWLTGPESSVEHKAVASRFVQLLEYMSDQISMVLSLHDDNDSLFADGTASSLAVNNTVDPSAVVAISINELLRDTGDKNDACSDDEANNAAITSFRLGLSVLGDGSCMVERTQEESAQKRSIESEENYLKIMSLHNEMEQMVKLDGADDLNPMNQRGALAAMKLGKLSIKTQEGDDISHANAVEANRSALIEDLTVESLKDLLDWMANVDTILTDLTGPLSTTVIQPQSLSVKHDAVDYLLNKTIPEILSVSALDAAESITAIVAAFIRKRRKLMELIPVRSEEDEEDELESDTDASLVAKAKNIFAGNFISRKNKNRVTICLSSVFVYLNYTQSVPATVSIAVATILALALTSRFVVHKFAMSRPEALTHIYEFIPEVSESCIPRQEITNQITDTIINARDTWVDEKMSADVDTSITMVCGAPGIGKTILASMVATSPVVHEAYPDGIVWLTFDSRQKIDYMGLVDKYGEICNQLSSVSLSRKLARLASSFDADLYAVRPEDGDGDENQLMVDLQKDFFTHLQLSTRRVLFVLDGLYDISDAQWFQSMKQSGKLGSSSSRQRYWRSHVLVTSSSAIQKQQGGFKCLPHWSRIVEVGLLSDHESKAILTNESSSDTSIEKLDSFVARGRDWAYSPLSLKCLGRFSSGHCFIYGNNSVNAMNSSSAALMKRLTILSQQACSSEAERTLLVVQESLVHAFSTMGGVGEVLRLCFSAFVALFYDTTTPWSSIKKSYVPATIATIFWDGLLNSDEIPVEHLMEIEKCLAADGEGVSRSSFVADCLVALGLLRHVSRDFGNRKKATGYAVEHEILIKAGLDLLVDTDDDDIAVKRCSWSVYLVHGYQEYLAGIGSRRDRWSKDYAYQQETQFIMRHIVKHMFLGGMGDKALELLTSESFIDNRLKQLGLLSGTMQHIADSEYLVQTLREQGEIVSLSGRSVIMSSAKLSLINSFEHIASHLTQVPGNYIEDFAKASAGLYLLGKSLIAQQWNNEAFFLFQESVNLCHVVLTYDRKSRNAVYRIIARALHHMGEIHKDKGDVGESIKNFTESLHYSNSARRGYKSIELDTMRSLRSLGEAHFLSGDVTSALKAHTRCLVVIESQYGQDHQRYAEGLQNIGMMYIKGRDADKARKFFLEALKICKELIGTETEEVAVSLHCLGMAHRDLGDHDFALENLTESINIWKRLTDSGSGDKRLVNIRYASTLHELGLLRRQRGELDEALDAYNEALMLRQTHLGDDHKETAHTLHCIGVAYCDVGAHENAMKAYSRSLQMQKKMAQSPCSPRSSESNNGMQSFTNALWASQALRAEAPSVEAIMQRCISMFGQDIINIACSAARIFACSSLMVDEMIRSESRSTSEKKKNGRGGHMEWLESMLPYMKAAVEAEMAVDARARKEMNNPASSDSRRKRVRFCSFDFSSVTSPVDMAVGSNEQLEHSIDALEEVVKEIERLGHLDGTSSSANASAKAKLLLVLYAITTPAGGKAMREACAEAMPNDDSGKPWPPARFVQASELYRAEIEAMVASSGEEISSDDEENANVVVVSTSPLRDRFSTQIGSAIRFHLRRLFDPLPMFFTLPSDKYQPPDLSGCRARTWEIVYLRAPDGIQPNTDGSSGPAPLWDRPISHVFNLALQRTQAYFEIIDEVKAALTTTNSGGSSASESPHSFALSQASQRCLDGRSKDKTVGEMDVGDILKDIDIAHTCLSAARASKFIITLLRWPGVAQAIEEAGGWTPIESLAEKLARFHLDKEFADEAHFAQLGNVESLLDLLDANRSDMFIAARGSQKVLQDMWKRFKRGGGGRLKRRHTYDSIIRQVLLDDSKTAVFPQLGTPGG